MVLEDGVVPVLVERRLSVDGQKVLDLGCVECVSIPVFSEI
ncbi:hypothetical protein [Natronoglomus mannanivorans]|uniref:Uncharacterized protein n=1 Tax=Natronoglomus mannanivorans TaxID=2979990 RepID=A0AAP2Z2X1_9EURY|nr:hypothetical protein [Halobacteria archaeon AArc-xg1-1]